MKATDREELVNRFLKYEQEWREAEDLLLILQTNGMNLPFYLTTAETDGRGDTDTGFMAQIQLKAIRSTNDSFAFPLWRRLTLPSFSHT
jgi:hypothetical protein